MGVSKQLPWVDPIALARAQKSAFVLLHSSAQTSYSGRYSFLACQIKERIQSTNFSALAQKLSDNRSAFDNAWFGYLGYGLKNSLEKLADDAPGFISSPNLQMLRPSHIYRFDHQEKTLVFSSEDESVPALPSAEDVASAESSKVVSLTSNMSRADYLEKAGQVIAKIHRGDLYQANFTRKFMGTFDTAPDALALFEKLCISSPAPYSAFLQLGDIQIISSSPESFLSIDATGRIDTRPIKGTAPRGNDEEAERLALQQSPKDQAENLMIVDLMRNDLSRAAKLGSVKVESLFDVTTHATIHHMSSSVTAQKADGRCTLDVVRECFPPGSMTGAPKIRAMNLCSELENQARGIYSGAIGWFGGDGSCELSVVIRTLILQGNHFEFQVGGGIVADSTPEKELQETFDKARGILAALGLPSNALEAI